MSSPVAKARKTRVHELASYVDEKVSELRQQLPPGTPEVKLLVFAALLLADESREARGMAKAGRDGARLGAPTMPRPWRPRSRN